MSAFEEAIQLERALTGGNRAPVTFTGRYYRATPQFKAPHRRAGRRAGRQWVDEPTSAVLDHDAAVSTPPSPTTAARLP